MNATSGFSASTIVLAVEFPCDLASGSSYGGTFTERTCSETFAFWGVPKFLLTANASRHVWALFLQAQEFPGKILPNSPKP